MQAPRALPSQLTKWRANEFMLTSRSYKIPYVADCPSSHQLLELSSHYFKPTLLGESQTTFLRRFLGGFVWLCFRKLCWEQSLLRQAGVYGREEARVGRVKLRNSFAFVLCSKKNISWSLTRYRLCSQSAANWQWNGQPVLSNSLMWSIPNEVPKQNMMGFKDLA